MSIIIIVTIIKIFSVVEIMKKEREDLIASAGSGTIIILWKRF